MKAMEWLCDRIFKYVATDEKTDAWHTKPLAGLNLPYGDALKIMSGNFTERVAPEPKPINKDALKRYYEKYKHLIKSEQNRKLLEELLNKML